MFPSSSGTPSDSKDATFRAPIPNRKPMSDALPGR